MLLLGASGSGKSTLLSALAGVLGGDDDGESVGELRIDGSAPEQSRGRAGLVLQDPDSQVVLSRIGNDVAFGCENLGLPAERIWPRVRAALDAVGLRLPLEHPTSRLSGGQKQRLALAGVLAMQPGLLLLDEPTANLDPDGVREVRDAVSRTVAETGATLIVIEHRVAIWQNLVDRVVVLSPAGGLLADGTVSEVLGLAGEALAAAGIWIPGREPAFPSPPARPGPALLQAEALSIARPLFGERAPRPVLENLTLTVSEGNAVALTGRNGAGKSTLALTLGGLLPPAAGRLTATNTLASGAGPRPYRWRSRALLPRIGTVFQDPEHQFLAGFVRAELAVGPAGQRLGPAAVRARVDELLARLQLADLADAHPFTLSGGQKRRLSVGTALACRPRVLILDEPTFGQDATTWRQLVTLLRELLGEGTALVAASHDESFVTAIGGSRLLLAADERERAPGGRASGGRASG